MCLFKMEHRKNAKTNFIPREVKYLQNYDEFKKYLDNHFEIPAKRVAMFVRFIEQNTGVLSKSALKKKEFSVLKDAQVKEIKTSYIMLFIKQNS